MTTFIASTLLWTVLNVLVALQYSFTDQGRESGPRIIINMLVFQQLVLSVVCTYYITKNILILVET